MLRKILELWEKCCFIFNFNPILKFKNFRVWQLATTVGLALPALVLGVGEREGEREVGVWRVKIWKGCWFPHPLRSFLFFRESPNYTFELSQKSDFEHSTTKPDNIVRDRNWRPERGGVNGSRSKFLSKSIRRPISRKSPQTHKS